MKPDGRYLGQPRSFWANVRTIGQAVGYTRNKRIAVPDFLKVREKYQLLGLDADQVVEATGTLTDLGEELSAYFALRAEVLNDYVEPRLMDAGSAEGLFEQLREQLQPNCPLPFNKQKGEKRAHAFFTGIINMLVEANAGGVPCDYDPRQLTTVTRGRSPLRTLSRRVDGAFPAAVNPIAIWEVKEYYYTTTFGSRVADGVYESLLDGMELEELHEHEGVKVLHYLMVDAHYTWWECGKSYLCRIFDMLHMGFVDEVLFGREVVERLPELVREWTAILRADR